VLSALRDVQTMMLAALLGNSPEPASAAILDDGLTAHGRLAIYRHHVFATLTDALKATFPVVCRLVDERFFGYAADRYIRWQPPTGACLFEYGESFPDFLATFSPCAELPYLPDVARLEWAMHMAEHAVDVRGLDIDVLSRLDPTDAACLRFGFDPSLTLLQSAWPIDDIWRANQDAAVPRVSLHGGGRRLEVRRRGEDVVCRRLEPAPWIFRSALVRGRTLEEAATVALALDPDFDLAGAVRVLLTEGLLTDVALPPAPAPDAA
jgi:Putative DNA-binding domain